MEVISLVGWGVATQYWRNGRIIMAAGWLSIALVGMTNASHSIDSVDSFRRHNFDSGTAQPFEKWTSCRGKNFNHFSDPRFELFAQNMC